MTDQVKAVQIGEKMYHMTCAPDAVNTNIADVDADQECDGDCGLVLGESPTTDKPDEDEREDEAGAASPDKSAG